MLSACWQALQTALCIVGLALAAALIFAVAVGVGVMILWWADYRGAWLDAHPETEEKKGGRGRE